MNEIVHQYGQMIPRIDVGDMLILNNGTIELIIGIKNSRADTIEDADIYSFDLSYLMEHTFTLHKA